MVITGNRVIARAGIDIFGVCNRIRAGFGTAYRASRKIDREIRGGIRVIRNIDPCSTIDMVIPFTTGSAGYEGVIAGIPSEGVIARGTGDGVITETAIDIVVTKVAIDDIVSIRSGDRVSTITTINRVVTEVAVNEIIASAACKDIGITRAIDGRANDTR